jgi:hypothetical protein
MSGRARVSRASAGGVVRLAVAAVLGGAGGFAGCAADPSLRTFPDRPVAWQEHDSLDVARAPEASELGQLDSTLLVRDSLAGEVDRTLALEGSTPARDVNAADEVPCSTWFCARNHRAPMTPEAIAAGPAGVAPRLPLRIVKGKDRGAALGFQVVDADGRKFLLKLDPAGHLGLATGAELVGGRLYHAAGYNVPSSFVVDLGEGDLVLDPKATFKLYRVQTRPLTVAEVKSRLAGAARTADGRLHAVAVSWIPGKVLGAFDMMGRRADDPNDRIRHEDRRSLRASWLFAAWLAVFDASAINTLDSYVEEDGRRFVRHYIIDFGAGLGSATNDMKGPHEGGQHVVEVGRTLASLLTFGLYRRPYESQRDAWTALVGEHPSIGWFPAEGFDVDKFRTNRTVPAHQRMTDRDGYWGAKVVTSFTDAQLAAVVGAAGLDDPREATYLERALRVRRDIIGRRYLTATTAVEAPEVVAAGSGGDARLCFDDLAIARGYAQAAGVRYQVAIGGERGQGFAEVTVPAQGARTCVAAAGAGAGYRVVAIRAELAKPGGGHARAKTSRVHLRGGRVVGLERDE